MPKYWGKQIFTHGRFPEGGEKQKAHASMPGPKSRFCMTLLTEKICTFWLNMGYSQFGRI